MVWIKNICVHPIANSQIGGFTWKTKHRIQIWGQILRTSKLAGEITSGQKLSTWGLLLRISFKFRTIYVYACIEPIYYIHPIQLHLQYADFSLVLQLFPLFLCWSSHIGREKRENTTWQVDPLKSLHVHNGLMFVQKISIAAGSQQTNCGRPGGHSPSWVPQIWPMVAPGCSIPPHTWHGVAPVVFVPFRRRIKIHGTLWNRSFPVADLGSCSPG